MMGEMMANKNKTLLLEEIKGNREVALSLLQASHPYFLDLTVEEDKKQISLNVTVPEYMLTWEELETEILSEQLRYLINIGQIYMNLSKTRYTYDLSPNGLVFDRNALPKFIFRGVVGQVPPYEALSEEQFLERFKAMLISLLDQTVDYESLVEGKLPFYKGDLFCEQILSLTSLSEVLEALEDKLVKERAHHLEHYSYVKNKVRDRFKLATFLSTGLAAVAVIGLAYFALYALPRQELISDIRLSYANGDYSGVVTRMKQFDGKELSQDDKYIAAVSVVNTEPFTDEQRQHLANLITKQSSESYLRYWITIGQAKLDDALDLASFLDDPQLLMYATTKKIDEIKRNPNLTAEERTEELAAYKEKLDELKEKYLVTETSSPSSSESSTEKPSTSSSKETSTSSSTATEKKE